MKKTFTLTLLLITSTCLVFDAHNRWKGDNWKATINADGYGYYAYLPAVFVLHSLDYEKIIKEERLLRPEVSYEDAKTCFPEDNGKRTDKFFAGESVLLLPFFTISYLVARIFEFDANGYSLPFQIGVSFGALFYLLIGLVFLRKLLKEYKFSESVISLTALILVTGTNLLYYSTIEPSMSHVYCFSLTAIFLYYMKVCCNNFSSLIAVKASAVFCLLIIVRPTNINNLAFVPFIAGDFASLKAFFRNIFNPRILLVIITVSLSVLLIQFVIWKIETGQFIYWSYRGERFYLTSPKFLSFLFSFRNGWFIYTPIIFLTLVGGLFILLKKNMYQFITFLFFLFFTVYLLSSWYAWYYTGFGMRAIVDYYAAFAILLALCLACFYKNLLLGIVTSVILAVLIFINITQTRQFINHILVNDYMNSEKYWKIFLRTDSRYVGILEKHAPTDINFLSNYSFENNFENNTWGNNNSLTDAVAHNDRHAAYIGDGINFSPVLSIKVGELSSRQNLYVYLEAAVFMPDSLNDASLIMKLQTKEGTVYSTINRSLKKYIPYFSDWEQIGDTIRIPSIKNSEDSLKIYFSATRGATYIDDEKVNFGIKK